MRSLAFVGTLLLLSPVGAAPAELSLLESQARAGKAYATDLGKLGDWCAERKLHGDAAAAFQEACAWDASNASLWKSLALVPEEETEGEVPELEARKAELGKNHARSFAQVALRAAGAKRWGMARRSVEMVRKLHPESPDLAGLDQALAEGAEALKALDDEIAQARSNYLFKPASDGRPEFALKLPRTLDTSKRFPLIIHIHGVRNHAKGVAGGLGRFCQAGFAVLFPTCPSSSLPNLKVAAREAPPILELIDLLAEEYGIDPDRVFLEGFSGGGQLAYTMIDKHRERLRGVVALMANFYARIEKAPAPTPFPVYIIQGEKDAENETRLTAQAMAAQAALKQAGFTDVTYEMIPGMAHSEGLLCEPQRLAWYRGILEFQR